MSETDWMREELGRLRGERDTAFRELSSMRSTLDELSRMIAKQNDQLDHVVTMLRRRETQLKRAEAQVRKLRKKLGLDPEPEPTSAPLPEESEASSDDDSSTSEEASGDTEAPSASTETPEPKPRPRSRGGRRPPPEHLPRDTERHEVCGCELCGGRTLHRDVLVTTVFSVVMSYVRARRIERERKVCANPDCGHATTAPMPPMPCNRALYDCRFLAWLVVMKFVLLVPLDRIRELLRTQGVDIAMGTLVHLIERAAELADPIDGEHMKLLRAGAYMCFDGTGLKALVLGQEKAWDAYFEVFTRDEITVFQFDLTKHADRLRRRINDFVGVLVCDAETRNKAGAPGVDVANCNAHPLRDLRKAEVSQPRLAVQGQRFIQALYELEHLADRLGLAGGERIAFRQRRSRRVLLRFRQWLEGVRGRGLPPSDPVLKLAKYYLKHWDDLTRFVDHPAVLPLDNNTSEREFQRHAKLRQSCLFAGSPEGGHRWATLFGVVRTAQKCHLDVLAYLTWMFERRGSHRKRFAMSAGELTPMAYREMLKAKKEAA